MVATRASARSEREEEEQNGGGRNEERRVRTMGEGGGTKGVGRMRAHRGAIRARRTEGNDDDVYERERGRPPMGKMKRNEERSRRARRRRGRRKSMSGSVRCNPKSRERARGLPRCSCPSLAPYRSILQGLAVRRAPLLPFLTPRRPE